jgi:uncharacterized protein YdcH (DUF465 family)
VAVVIKYTELMFDILFTSINSLDRRIATKESASMSTVAISSVKRWAIFFIEIIILQKLKQRH